MLIGGRAGAAYNSTVGGYLIASGSVGGTGNSSLSYSPVLSSIGVQAGDFGLILGTDNTGSPVSGGGAWTSITSYQTGRLLTGADIASSGRVGCQNGSWAYAFYRGPRSAVQVRHDVESSGNATATIPGFAKHSTHVGLVATARHYIAGSGGTPGLPTTPATWTTRRVFGDLPGNAYYRIADRLSPANALYVEGTGIQWTTYFGSIPAEGDEIWILELRS